MAGRIAVARAVWKFRWLLAATCAVLSVAALGPLSTLAVSNSLDIWYPQDDPVLEEYRRFLERYGSDELVVVAVSDAGGFDDGSALERISALTDELYGVDGVADVISMTTVPDSMLGIEQRLLSDDARSTALLLRMEGGPELEADRHAILLRIRQVVAEAGMPARFAGFGVIYDTLNQASTEGSAALVGAAHLAMLVLLGLCLRRALPTLVTLLAVCMAAIWTMGTYAAFGTQLNMVTMVLPTLVLVIGIADCVHLLRSVAREDRSLARDERVVTGIAHALGPCLLTSLTTAAGFFALALSDLPIVRGLGLFGAFGVIAALITSLCIVPAALSFAGAEADRSPAVFDRIPRALHHAATGHPLAVTAGFLLLAGFLATGIGRIKVDTYSIGYLADDHPVRVDSDLIEASIGAYASIDFVVRSRDVLAPELLRSVELWQQAAAAHPGVDWSWSLLDAAGIRSTGDSYAAMTGAVGRLRVLAPDVLDGLLAGRDEMRVSFGAPMMSAREVQALVDELLELADFPTGVNVVPAGYAAAYTRIVDRLVIAQRDGFAGSFLLVFAALAVALRSTRRLLLAVPANLLPVLATLGLMGWSGIPLDIATVTIASVLLGLIVDDTVHLLWPRGGAGIGGSLARATERSGGALLMTSLILGCGFLVLGLAEIRSVAWFGRLACFTVGFALATDLLLLPALSALLDRVMLKPARESAPGVTC
ncbi:MAG: MMPL family transporter [Gammaproteobacteria bacterium]|nr:MMPL family transporter [Gammaproteobacteria bacterium]MDH4255615.1 MMPL family transporter [Gammaproteobacteria bacterium]MDH5310345.1 MMPL family transporter [Gammaproteobacteria bacterium]